jgi:glycosyltransferase involved in cell wall biosynthesis
MTLPRLTIITPSLNQAQYLERTLRSVLDQGYQDLEYIVMDGGSTDGSVDILERYDDRLAHWQSESDEGQSWAINRAIERSTGDVIAYINSDDYYLPGAFDAAMPRFEDADVRWVAGACEYLSDDGTLETVWRPKRPRGPRPRWVREIWYAPQASSFWRRDVFDEFGLLREDLHFVFDAEFGLRLAIAGVSPRIIEDTLAVRFLHDEAKSADGERFMVEYGGVAQEFDKTLARWEHALDATLFFLLRVVRALNPLRLQYRLRKKLGLLDLRERWFGAEPRTTDKKPLP